MSILAGACIASGVCACSQKIQPANIREFVRQNPGTQRTQTLAFDGSPGEELFFFDGRVFWIGKAADGAAFVYVYDFSYKGQTLLQQQRAVSSKLANNEVLLSVLENRGSPSPVKTAPLDADLVPCFPPGTTQGFRIALANVNAELILLGIPVRSTATQILAVAVRETRRGCHVIDTLSIASLGQRVPVADVRLFRTQLAKLGPDGRQQLIVSGIRRESTGDQIPFLTVYQVRTRCETVQGKECDAAILAMPQWGDLKPED